MKTSPALSARLIRAFTLVEILVVIVIISVLASILVPQVVRVIHEGHVLKTQALMQELKNGIGSFHTDYGRLPLAEAPPADEDMELLTDGSTPLIDALMGLPATEGEQAALNPKGTRFSEFSIAKNERDGVVNTARPHKLHDYWGHPLRVLLDTSGDHQIKNPDTQNTDPAISQPGGKPAGEFLSLDLAIYSVGKDGVAFTADDVTSWRQ
ncbi:MAG: prepilin-type N-terminal cleavage/methylation domain-containing protein [Verrucomicrobiaceae bacterium]|nr:prepilin-type N-terminal cleavage/methylation domain-containing protein [Verrucomicrobiaceae bacterium]